MWWAAARGAGGFEVGQRGMRMLRSSSRRRRKQTDLVLKFDPDELQARLSVRDSVAKGMDAVLRCRHCKWSSTTFPYEPWVVRGYAEQHFDYDKAQRAYWCKRRP